MLIISQDLLMFYASGITSAVSLPLADLANAAGLQNPADAAAGRLGVHCQKLPAGQTVAGPQMTPGLMCLKGSPVVELAHWCRSRRKWSHHPSAGPERNVKDIAGNIDNAHMLYKLVRTW